MEIKQTFKIKKIEMEPSVVIVIKDMVNTDALTLSSNRKIALNKIKNMIVEYAMSLDEDCLEETPKWIAKKLKISELNVKYHIDVNINIVGIPQASKPMLWNKHTLK